MTRSPRCSPARFHAYMLGEDRVYAIPRRVAVQDSALGRTLEQHRRNPAQIIAISTRGQAIANGWFVGEVEQPPLQAGLVDEQRRGLGAHHLPPRNR